MLEFALAGFYYKNKNHREVAHHLSKANKLNCLTSRERVTFTSDPTSYGIASQIEKGGQPMEQGESLLLEPLDVDLHCLNQYCLLIQIS